MHKLGETESAELVAKISERLWKAKIPHQVVSTGTEQAPLSEIWLVREEDLPLAVEILNSPETNKVSESNGRSPLVASLSYAKVTWFFIITCVLVALLTRAGANVEMVAWFSIVPIQVIGNRFLPGSLDVVFSTGEFWRLFTPALIHFGGLHLVFNMLWVWEFGRRIEQVEGKMRLFIVLLASAVISNLGQYFAGSVYFGGMSGVIYAFLGYMVVTDKLSTHPKYEIPTFLVGFMLVWLALGFTQFTKFIGLGGIANAAHTVGLISGVGISVLARLIFHRKDQTEVS
ncbi:rhomboid family intramembrane serine protease [Litoribrevibacter albus]|uniref:Rhomboid family intramembrane serine protease n=1 Tax=Litoribrevibacter albus TaxID=1473156 RepID=A0AA37SAC5_9GAMM|nr:rhomboid family intramembrane serine protease [Litoribrevibacter albus]GLQ32317.1 rhomboid family intramembrane serine protease [Litoribrevibacter albus]